MDPQTCEFIQKLFGDKALIKILKRIDQIHQSSVVKPMNKSQKRLNSKAKRNEFEGKNGILKIEQNKDGFMDGDELDYTTEVFNQFDNRQKRRSSNKSKEKRRRSEQINTTSRHEGEETLDEQHSERVGTEDLLSILHMQANHLENLILYVEDIQS